MESSRHRPLDGPLQMLREEFPERPADPRNWPAAERLLPQVLALATGGETEEEESTAVLLDRAASFEFARGHLSQALDLGRKALDSAASLGDVKVVGDVHQTLGRINVELDRGEDARQHVEQALRVHLAAPDADEEAVRDDRIVLADVLVTLDQLAAARDQLERVTPDEGEELRDTADCRALAASAWLHHKEGDQRQSLAQYERVLEETERIEGPDSSEVIPIRIGRGVVLAEDKQFEEGQGELERALHLSEQWLGEGHPTGDVIRSELGSALLSQSKFAEARDQLEIALHNGEKTLPHDHRGLWVRHRKLASVLRRLGEPEAALIHLEQAVALSEQREPRDAARIGGDRLAEAELLVKLGRDADAYRAYEQAREAYQSADLATPNAVAVCEAGLGRTAEAQGHRSSARRHLEAALLIFDGIDGNEAAAEWAQGLSVELAKVSAEIAEELAASCRALGQPVLARGLLDRGREAFSEVLGGIVPTATLASAISVSDAARESVPAISFEAMARAEAQMGDGEEERLRVGKAWHRLGRSCRFQKEAEHARAAFEASLPLLEGDDQLQGVTLHDLAEIAADQGRLEKAVDLYRRAVELKRKSEESQEDLANTLVALGRALIQVGQVEEAKGIYEQGGEVLAALPERNYWMEALLLEDLGDLNLSAAEHEKAIELFQQAVDSARGADDRTLLANILVALGRALFKAGRLEEAIKAHEERLQILGEEAESDLQAKAITLHDIADVRQETRDFEGAANLYAEAADLKRQAAENPADLAGTLLAQARMLSQLDRFEEAESVLEERLVILRSLPEPRRRSEAITLHEIGSVRRNLRRPEEALQAYREAEAIEREVNSVGELSATLLFLGRTLKELGDAEGALAAYEERLSLVDDPQSTGVTLHDIADIRMARGEDEEALSLYRRAAGEKRKVEGKETDLAITLGALGQALRGRGDLAAALEIYDERIELLAGLPEPDVVGQAVTLQEAVEALRALGRGEEGVGRYEKATRRARAAGVAGEQLVPLLLGEAAVRLAQGEAEGTARLGREAIDQLRATEEPNADLLSAALLVAAEASTLKEDERETATRLGEAIGVLEATPRSDPFNLAILKQRSAAAHRRLGEEETFEARRAEARGFLRKALDGGIANTAMLPVAAVLSIDAGAPELAATVVERARDLAAPPREQQGGTVLADVLRGIGRAQLGAEDLPAALSAFAERVRVLEALPQRSTRSEGEAYRDLGDAQRGLEQPLEAIASFRTAAERFMGAEESFSASNALRLLAAVHADREEWTEALAVLEERYGLLRQLPPSPRRARFEAVTLEAKATILLAQKQPREALGLVDEAISLLEALEQGDADEKLAARLQELRDRISAG